MENFNLKLYMAEIDSVKKYLHSSSDLSKHLNELDNYLEQVKCVNKSRLFLHLDESDAIFDFENKFSSLCKVNKEETKQKLLFKITSLINESIHSTKIIMLVKSKKKIKCMQFYYTFIFIFISIYFD